MAIDGELMFNNIFGFVDPRGLLMTEFGFCLIQQAISLRISVKLA